MKIPVVANTPPTRAESAIAESAGPKEQQAAGPTKSVDAPSARIEARDQLNSSIVEASLAVSISSQNEPLALLLKSAITSLNETLRPDFGEDAIENAASQDNTAEGTAGRIVSLSTGFFEAFKKQHPGEEEGAVLKQFMSTIKGGFERGFKEAQDILQGLNVLNGDIAGNIDKTYALVQKGYADFEASFAKAPGDAAAPADR